MSAATAAVARGLLTAEEFGELPDTDCVMELIQGAVVRMPPPKPRHGQVCSRTNRIVGNFVDAHDLGHVLCNDAGVITERDPDTVRGADVAFYSYDRLPKGPLPEAYLDQAPDIVWEVLSPDDRWTDVMQKTTEYLSAGVRVVCLLDPETKTAWLYYPDQPPRQLNAGDTVTLAGVLPGFSEPLSRFFQ